MHDKKRYAKQFWKVYFEIAELESAMLYDSETDLYFGASNYEYNAARIPRQKRSLHFSQKQAGEEIANTWPGDNSVWT